MSTLDAITRAIQSPPGQLAAGAALAGMTWKSFERVEAVLSDNTKLEIAVWLLDRHRASSNYKNWPDTFANIFDQIFGKRHFSMTCFVRSAMASLSVAAVVFMLALLNGAVGVRAPVVREPGTVYALIVLATTANIIPDYIALLLTRVSIYFMSLTKSWLVRLLILVLDFVGTAAIGVFALMFMIIMVMIIRGHLYDTVYDPGTLEFNLEIVLFNGSPLWMIAVFTTSIWLWLYAGAGLLLVAMRRLGPGFDWFNRTFEIENKPLQSIGFFAGAMVAVTYWVVIEAASFMR